ncbi:MAG: aspartyl/glutamyl-tRNA(Asn/Gln) amidotransferase subunit [Actinomycetia bacterium]|nr:aspartyl/glutamyl-tRNA(Asn/Gln) amidotransferase subunit [Actinomycetes bacterium]
MAHRITHEDVLHVANLARLALTEREVDEFTVQLGAILEHAAQVEALDTEGVPPTAHPLPLVNVLRADVLRPGVDRDEILAAAPEAEQHRFRVPRILAEDEA